MDRAADIEIGEMEKHLGHLGLIAGITYIGFYWDNFWSY
jgi:hypothetical protein